MSITTSTPVPRVRRRRASAGLLAGSLLLALLPAGAAADEPPAPVEHAEGWCAGDEGVSLAVDFGELDPTTRPDPVVRCALGSHGDGFDVLDGAGFATEQLPGGGFLCTIDALPEGGTDDGGAGCLFDGFWAYWVAEPGDETWTFSTRGAAGRTPAPGTAEAWSWTPLDGGSFDGRVPSIAPFEGAAGDGSDDRDPLAPVPPVDLDADLVAAEREAAGWLGRQLEELGTFGMPDFPDWGLTLDAVLALAAAGIGEDVAVATMERMRDTEPGQQFPTFNASSAAKTMLAVQAIGEDPATFLDVDLEAAVRDRLGEDGRFQNQSSFGQSLAIMALSDTTAGVPDLAIDWLLSVQCDDGAFHPFACTRPDGDHTGVAVQALLTSGSTDADVAAAVDAAAGWLDAAQADDGSFAVTFDGSTFTPNTNSTGLAGQGLRALGEGGAADLAGDFVASMQLGCDDLTGDLDRDDLGALAYGQQGRDAAVADGITRVARDQFHRATPQAILTFAAPVMSELTFDGAEAGLPDAPACDDGDDGDGDGDGDGDDGDGGDGGDEPPVTPAPPFDRGIDRICDGSTATRFTDVGGPHARAVTCLEGLGLTEGSSDPTRFRPADDVTRGQMASFLDRLLRIAGSPLPAAPDAFRDDDGSAHEGAIDRLTAAGIVRGRNDGTFGPGDPVDRGQAAAMVARTLDVLDDGERNGSFPPASTVDVFGDDDGLVFEPEIDALAVAGVVQGFGDGRYGPNRTVLRAQMASMLARSLDLAVEAELVDPQVLP